MVIYLFYLSAVFTAHPWLRDETRAVPLDLVIYKLVKSYVRATPFRRAAIKVTYIHNTMCFPSFPNHAGKFKQKKG